MKRILCAILAALLVLAPEAGRAQEASRAAAEQAPTGRTLSLPQVVEQALENNPLLETAGHQRSADAAFLGVHDGSPNPELALETEDFLGTGAAEGVRALQATATLSHPLQLGRKPARRRAARQARHSVSDHEWQSVRQRVVANVSMAYLDVLGWQRRLENVKEMARLAEETHEAIAYQVEAGRGTPIEADKAAIAQALAALDEERVLRALFSAKQRLAMQCGSATVDFEGVSGSVEHIEAVPALAALLKRVDQHPSLLVRKAEIAHQQALLDLEIAKRAPDVSLGVGYRWINATSDSAFVAHVAVPLPVVDRNRGAIGAARQSKAMSQSVARQARLQLIGELTEAYHALVLEQRRAVVLRDDIRPRVLATFRAVKEGYALGRFGYLDLLDAQRTLFEVNEQSIETLIAYHRAEILLKQAASLPLGPASFQ